LNEAYNWENSNALTKSLVHHCNNVLNKYWKSKLDSCTCTCTCTHNKKTTTICLQQK